jgi:hypothetical protein
MAPILRDDVLARLAVAAVVVGCLICSCRKPPPEPRIQSTARSSLPADVLAEQKLLEELGGRFHAFGAQYFSIFTDLDYGQAEAFERAADETYTTVWNSMAFLGYPGKGPSHKLPVLVFGEWADYQSWAHRAGLNADKATPGFFEERSNRCMLFCYDNLPLIRQKRKELEDARTGLDALEAATDGATGLSRDETEQKRERVRRLELLLASCESLIDQTVVRHEIAHQVLHNFGVLRPGDDRLWLKEGLAMQYESDSPFVTNRYRLADFFAEDRNATTANLRSLIADPSRLSPSADRLPEAYAAAGVLVNYLIDRKPAAFADYLRPAPAETSSPSDDRTRMAGFEAAFGPLDEDFALEFRRYTDGLRHRLMDAGDGDEARTPIQQKGMQP